MATLMSSVLDELPAGRGKIISGVRVNPKVSGMTKFLIDQLEEGRQVYLVYPARGGKRNGQGRFRD